MLLRKVSSAYSSENPPRLGSDLKVFERIQLSVLRRSNILRHPFQKLLCILGNVFSYLCKVPFSSALEGWLMQKLKMSMQPYSDGLEHMCYDIDFNWCDCIPISFINDLLCGAKGSGKQSSERNIPKNTLSHLDEDA